MAVHLFYSPYPPSSHTSPHRAPFKCFEQVNRKGDEESQIRQTPACVLTCPSFSISHAASPPLKQQSLGLLTTHSSELSCVLPT